jgi:hypothetical protein
VVPDAHAGREAVVGVETPRVKNESCYRPWSVARAEEGGTVWILYP